MIYGVVNVFQGYAACVTADDEQDFLRLFCEIVLESVYQYESYSGSRLEQELKEPILINLEKFRQQKKSDLESLFFDLNFDVDGYKGTLGISYIFHNKQDVLDHFQPLADEVNEGCDDDEKWEVFNGGFFENSSGYIMDELFK